MYSQVPIVFLSDIRDEAEIVKALEMGSDEYITKPSRQLEFMAHVRVLLRKRGAQINTSNQTKRRLRQ